MKTKDKVDIVKDVVVDSILTAVLLPIPLILLIAGITLAYRL